MIADATSRTTLDHLFIGGQWIAPSTARTQPVYEAGTGDLLGSTVLGTAPDFDAAVRSARKALDEGPWGRTTASERAEILRRFAAALSRRSEETARLVTQENGTPFQLSQGFNGAAPAALLNMYADVAESTSLREVRPSANGATIVNREPVGVVGAIYAWNGPQIQAMFKVAPALAAGCTVVLKPPTETALDARVFGEAANEAGLPPGVLNIVVADREDSLSLITHPLVDKISFTGSTAAGRVIGAECGRLIKRCTLELGGKSAAIVLDDADLDRLSAGLVGATFLNGSQNCTTQSRILAPRSRYEEVVEAVAETARDLKVGDPFDPATTCGPMATQGHLERVLGFIESANSSGARLVAGGGRPKGLDRGWFVEPTVFADVDNNDRLAREEVFGPVIAVIPYENEDDAVRLANDSEYGLGGSVWTADEAHGIAVANRIRTGTIGVNYYEVDLGAPFGGVKQSGIGRELGPEGLHDYLDYKSTFVSADQLA